MSNHGHHAQHLYTQHPPKIHPTSLRTRECAAFFEQVPTGLWSPSYPQHTHTHTHSHSHSHSANTPPYLLLHPFLQLARIDELHQSAAHTPFPAVIVSPHSLSPPPLRDAARAAPKKPPSKPAPTHRDTADGNKEPKRSVLTSAPTMTSNGVPDMCSKQDEPGAQARVQQQQRPSLVSQHSNSVPSTPMQVPRKYETRSRSPSPNSGLGSHSPRSVASEANSAMPTLRPARPFKCKFETNVGMLGRRRVPYQSDELLEPAKEEPKKTLDPHEDDKLSGDMRELYDRIQPTKHDEDIRDKFVKKVERILELEFPGAEMKVLVFGSSGNMLWTAESDVDICIQTPMKRLEEVHPLAEALDKHGMERVVCIPAAKVRIVKVWDPELHIACDINVNNVAAIENTRMIKTYIQLDERVRPLAMIIKHWTKRRILNDAGIGGTISSYTWICLILNFLQTQDPPILPVLHELPHRQIDKSTGQPSLSSFADDVEKLRGFGAKNKQSLGNLLFHFFRAYGHEVDYEKEAISVRQGKRIKREEKGWHPGGGQKEGVNRLCVEEPFNTDRNLGNSADGYAWRGIHLELRRAFDLLADGQQLAKACEQFEYPPEEKSTSIFQKPQSQKATITSSVPIRNGRGGSNQRGGRGGLSLKSQQGNSRRSSNSSNYSQNRPFLHSPPINGAPGSEYFSIPRGLPEQLHDQLYQQYQMLEMQSNSLRAQLAAQQHAQQAYQVRTAQQHAHAIAHAQAQNRAQHNTSGSPQKSAYMNGHSPRLAELGIPPNAFPPGFLYHYPGFYNASPPDAAGSQDGTRTNPSSPSLSNSAPGVRRAGHRVSNASETSNLRSHSQPPRGLPQQPVMVGYPPVPQIPDPTGFPGYPITRSTTHDPPGTQPTTEVPYLPIPQPKQQEPAAAVPVSVETIPKEHVGYYVADSPVQPRPLQEYAVSQIPSFSELAQRRRRVSSEITQPLLNTALRRVSRSPSPLGGHLRSYSTGVKQPSVPADEQRKARIDSARPPVDSGPVIVNGSFPTQPRLRSDTVDVVPPEMSIMSGLGMHVDNSQAMHQIGQLQEQQQMVYEEMQRQKSMENRSPQIVNGSMKTSPAMESNGLARVPSEGQQPFSTFSEGWINYEAGSGRRANLEEDISPTRTVAPAWRTPAFVNGLPSLETSNTPRPEPQEIKSATLPLLSPVYETRTPSPSASRISDLNKWVNGSKPHAKDNGQQHRRASHAAPNHANGKDSRNGQQKSSQQSNGHKPNTGSNTSNGWQQQGSGRTKKGKSKKAKAEQKTAGEPMPANASERKGG
ncbi:hypothetical protein IAQ61_007223 [Plenodomus lingam]|uniref:uncharacterized protein n=1 Tax=Leptosphaeria maculans TaxID=5022 RepID=UPI00332A742C|nr:hypothetical protein IAQ61_007223 [Plenodomus lingam]